MPRPLLSLALVLLAFGTVGPAAPVGPGGLPLLRALVAAAVVPAVCLGRRGRPELAAAPLLLLGPAMHPGMPAGLWLAWAAAVLAGPPFLARLPLRLVAGVVALLLGAYLLRLFPPATWTHLVLADDYGTVLYNTRRDLEALAAGGVVGWDHAVEGGRPLVLSLRTLAPFFLPFFPLGLGTALHLVLCLTVAAFPLLTVAALRAFRPRRPAGAAAAGGLLAFFVVALLLRHGMLYSAVALDLFLLQLLALEGLRRRRRGSTLLLGGGVALGVYVHLAQQALTLPFLALWLRREGRGVPGRRLAAAALVAAGLSLPYLGALWEHRDLLQPRHVLGAVPALAHLVAVGPLESCRLVLGRLLWEFPGAFRLGFVLLPFLVRSEVRGLRRLVVLSFLPLLFLWLPGVGLALLRFHLLALPVLALAAGRLLGALAARDRGLLLTGLCLGVLCAPETDLAPAPLYAAPSLAAAEPELTHLVAVLPGHRVLFENGAGNSPLRDLERPYEAYPGTEAHRAGPLVLATGRDLFAHAGWDAHPYHRLHDAYLVNGAYLGRPLAEAPPGRFPAALRRYGVTCLVVWSREARRYLDARPEEYTFLGEIPGRTRPVVRPPYRVYRFRRADGRAVRVPHGEAFLVDRGPFHYTVAVRGGRAGDLVVLAARFLPGWSVTADGTTRPARAAGGCLAARLPRDGDVILRWRYDRRRRYLLGGGLFLLAGLILLARRPSP